MDKLFRFSDYDVFAYLAAGLAVFVVCDLVIGSRWVIGASWGASDALLMVFAAYIVGHIVASPAAWILERQVVRRLLGRPSEVLFRDEQRGWRRLLQR